LFLNTADKKDLLKLRLGGITLYLGLVGVLSKVVSVLAVLKIFKFFFAEKIIINSELLLGNRYI